MDQYEPEYIKDLIQEIEDAEAPASVTNAMVARVFKFLNALAEQSGGEIGELASLVSAEQTARAAADGELAGKISGLETQAETASGQMAEIESAVFGCQQSVDSLRDWLLALPLAGYDGELPDSVTVLPTAPYGATILQAGRDGLRILYDSASGGFVLSVDTKARRTYHSTWPALPPLLNAPEEYVPGILLVSSGTPRVFHTWDGQGKPRLLGDLSDIFSTLTLLKDSLGDLVYKTNKLRSEVDRLTPATNDLAARVTALEDGTGGSGGEVGECGCGAIASERIEALFAEEPEGPADGEPVTTAQLDDLIDDGVAQTPVESPPGEYRLDEDDINALIEDIFK